MSSRTWRLQRYNNGVEWTWIILATVGTPAVFLKAVVDADSPLGSYNAVWGATGSATIAYL